MYVREIRIAKFRHLENVNLGPFPLPPDQSDLVALAGPNGGGKSSILELLGYALSNTWSLSWALSRSFPSFSFEVAIGVSPEERALLAEAYQGDDSAPLKQALDDLDREGQYFRAFNFDTGEYAKNPTLYNQVHNYVSSALRDRYQRSLGFFLKPDRTYPVVGFSRDRIFAINELQQLSYIWGIAFNTSEIQYKDMYDFLVQQRYHYFRRLGSYHHQKEQGQEVEPEPPTDPLAPYDALLGQLFEGYSFSDAGEEIPSDLFVQIPSGEVLPFRDLSSGEKEVFFILSFFLRHDVSNAVIVVDEPELHLHPELARKLVRTMQAIKPGNQLWLATHNAEIIDEAGRDRVIFVSRDAESHKAVVTLGVDEDEAVTKLRDLFGFSGYVGVARTFVFLEGEASSSDRKIFSTLFPSYGSSVKFVPYGSVEEGPRLNAAILSILEANLGWMKFYLVRDRDYLTDEMATGYSTHPSGRVYVLKRYHIENYLLIDELIAAVEKDIYGKQISAEEVAAVLRGIAVRISGEVMANMASYRANYIFRGEDFSLGNLFRNTPMVDQDLAWIDARVSTLREKLTARATEVETTLTSRVSPDALNGLISVCQEAVSQALSTGEWRSMFPGRRLLEEYARERSLGKPLVLQNALIKELGTKAHLIPEELQTLLTAIASDAVFTS